MEKNIKREIEITQEDTKKKLEERESERKKERLKKQFENQHYELIQVGDNYQLTFGQVTP